MKLQQLSVFIENRPGHLQHVLKVLADEKINIITLTIAESTDFGILRLIVEDPQKTAALLKSHQITSTPTDVLAIEIDDTPGSLYKAIDTFTRNNLNIEYMYAFTEKRRGKGVMIFRFDDIEAARSALKNEGFTILDRQEILGDL